MLEQTSSLLVSFSAQIFFVSYRLCVCLGVLVVVALGVAIGVVVGVLMLISVLTCLKR